MRTPSAIAAFLVAALACACSPADQPQPQTPAASSAQVVPAAAETPKDVPRPAAPMIRTEPATLPNCTPPTRVEVVWDARTLEGVTTVDIVLVNRKGREALFLTGGRMGRKETGAWMQSGTQLVLRAHADGTELARTEITGTPCANGVPAEAVAGPGTN